MEWKHIKRDGTPPCDGERVFVGANTAGFFGCFNQHGFMSTIHGPLSICFYDTAEGGHEVMTDLEWYAELEAPRPEQVQPNA